MDRRSRFIKIYEENGFKGNESKSGPGSDDDQTKVIKKELPKLFTKYSIHSIIDVPCGDFRWMRDVLKQVDVDYLGLDIVPELIKDNQVKYSTSKINFAVGDLVEEINATGDLMICRDCLVHLSFESTKAILKNICKSNIKYFLATSFTLEHRKNISFEDGTNWYPINLIKEPFNFPQPLEILNENCSECGGRFSDKSLCLWKVEDLCKHLGC